MEKSIKLLKQGFESSSETTDEFLSFYRTFKSEFTKELKKIGAEKIQIGKGHFYISGFFTKGEQVWYFNFGDVRWSTGSLLYRTAKHYTDYTGGSNQYVDFTNNLVSEMRLS